MKRICSLLLTLALVLGLCACGSKAPTWQEQYDLGVKYLSEGNYEEAIIAFNAAIEIDPKRPEAYAGLADVYAAQGDMDSLRAILEQGVEATGDSGLRSRLTSISSYGNRGDSAFWSWDKSETYDENGLCSVYQAIVYNQQGLPVAGEETETRTGDVTKYRFEWTEQGQLIRISIDNGDIRDFTIQYDTQGRIESEQGATCEYDEQGRVVKSVFESDVDGSSYTSCDVFTYDDRGRLARHDYSDESYGETYRCYTIYTYSD